MSSPSRFSANRYIPCSDMNALATICLAAAAATAWAAAEPSSPAEEPLPIHAEQPGIFDSYRKHLELCVQHNRELLRTISRMRETGLTDSVKRELEYADARFENLQKQGDEIRSMLAAHQEELTHNHAYRQYMSEYRHGLMEQLCELQALLTELQENDICTQTDILAKSLMVHRIEEEELRYEDTDKRYHDYAQQLLQLYAETNARFSQIKDYESAEAQAPKIRELFAQIMHTSGMLEAYSVDDPEGIAHLDETDELWAALDNYVSLLQEWADKIYEADFYGSDALAEILFEHEDTACRA